ncbi:kinase-like protein [Calocera cornea HHB12733]|uniref:Kinase-like protein n=1 Tax=Calocera cornea HHB12733 TaxID=1353952 RepID=A0A165D1C0_9BASI|nr:kinase-like protein [Calocera cornea HHB12733]
MAHDTYIRFRVAEWTGKSRQCTGASAPVEANNDPVTGGGAVVLAAFRLFPSSSPRPPTLSPAMAPTSRARRAAPRRSSQPTLPLPSVIPNSHSFEPVSGVVTHTPSWGKLMGQGVKIVDLFADKLVYNSRHILKPTASAPAALYDLLERVDFDLRWTGEGIPGRGVQRSQSGPWSPEQMSFTLRNNSPYGIRVGSIDVAQNTSSHISWGQIIGLRDSQGQYPSDLPAEYLEIVFFQPHIPNTAPAPMDAFTAEYTVERPVNSGQFGTVFRCLNKFTGQQYAVKIIKKKLSLMTESEMATIERECEIMRQMHHHPNIVNVHRTYMCADQLYILMELVQGHDLFANLTRCKGFDEADTRYIIGQLISGMAHVHSHGVAHRDLKPENILISSSYPPTLKIVDFGMAKHAHSRTALKTHCGTQIYAAPEVFSKEIKSYDISVDVWSIGVIMFTLLACHYPWDIGTDAEPEWRPSSSTMKFDLLHGKLNAEGWDLLSRLVVDDPGRRIKLSDALAHPWLHQPHPRPNSILAPESESHSLGAPLTPMSQNSGNSSLHGPDPSWGGARTESFSLFQTPTSARVYSSLQGTSSYALVMPGGLPMNQSSILLTPLPSLRSSAPATDRPAGTRTPTPTRASARLRAKKSSSLPRTRSSSNMSMLAKRRVQRPSRPSAALETPRMQTRSVSAGERKRGMNPALAV